MKIKNTKIAFKKGDIVTKITAGAIEKFTVDNGVFRAKCSNNISLKIRFVNHKTVQICYELNAENNDFPFSYAIENEGIALSFDHKNLETSVMLHTSKLTLYVSKVNMQVSMFDNNNICLNNDTTPVVFTTGIQAGIYDVQVTKWSQSSAYITGLGDKASSLNLKGRRFENWNTDAFAYGQQTDPLYKTIPFYYELGEQGSFGVFVDNTYRTYFDFKDTATTFGACGGSLNYYYFIGKPNVITQSYAALTGKAPLPPLWSLGYQQCRWSYYPQARVLEVASKFRQLQIPCDAIYLDIDYMNKYQCFTWDMQKFPKYEEMLAQLKQMGMRTVVMIDPGIDTNLDYSVYLSGLENNVFCRRSNGELMVGPVWPQACVFPDFTKQSARKWWMELYNNFMKCGIDGVWNDMNEPALFKVKSKTFSEEVQHDYEGKRANHGQMHNVYGMQMTRASFDGISAAKAGKRVFLLTRATYSGGQRYASVWTGDNTASWPHLRIALRQCVRLSISGFSFCGSDIGGFVNDPSGELYIRWLQLSIFHPLMRTHTMGHNPTGTGGIDDTAVIQSQMMQNKDQEPWSFGEVYTMLAKEAICVRYRLLTYMYTTLYQHTIDGTAVLRPLCFDFDNEPPCYLAENQFMCGPSLMVAPIVERNSKRQKLYLPQGKWYYLGLNESVFTASLLNGGDFKEIEVDMHSIPIFAKAGSFLTEDAVMNYTNEKPQNRRVIHYFFDVQGSSSSFYFDEGDGFEYKTKGGLVVTFTASYVNNELTIRQERAGSFNLATEEFEFRIHGVQKQPFFSNTRPNTAVHCTVLTVKANFESCSVKMP